MSAVGGTLLLLAWGFLAFGAVYPWAYWPLFTGAALIGLAGVAGFPGRAPRDPLERLIASACLALIGACVLQLVPMPIPLLSRLDPAADDLLRRYDPAYAAGLAARHPLSIDPRASAIGLAGLAALLLMLAGLTRRLDEAAARRLVSGLAIVGGLGALIGIVQAPLYQGRIYGFWTPQQEGHPFGPFVNRNHFAGWMLMLAPLSVGLVCARLERAARRTGGGLRGGALWLASDEGSRTVLAGCAALLVGVSILLSLSRSGVICFGAALLMLALAIARRRGASRRLLAAVCVALVVSVASWMNFDALASRFGADDRSLVNRVGAWSDAAHIAGRFFPFGTGLSTYGIATLLYQQHDLSVHYEQAHNDYLQLAAEGGLLLTVPAAAVAIGIVLLARKRLNEDRGSSSYWIRMGAIVGLLTIAIQEAVDFSLQIPANAVLFVTLCAIALHRRSHSLPAVPSA